MLPFKSIPFHAWECHDPGIALVEERERAFQIETPCFCFWGIQESPFHRWHDLKETALSFRSCYREAGRCICIFDCSYICFLVLMISVQGTVSWHLNFYLNLYLCLNLSFSFDDISTRKAEDTERWHFIPAFVFFHCICILIYICILICIYIWICICLWICLSV